MYVFLSVNVLLTARLCSANLKPFALFRRRNVESVRDVPAKAAQSKESRQKKCGCFMCAFHLGLAILCESQYTVAPNAQTRRTHSVIL